MTKYKYTRKELLKRLKKDFYKYMGGKEDFNEDLLAQKEDRKECKHKFVETYTGGKRCNKCNMSLTEFKYSTPSPLEIEEIEKMSNYADTCEYIRTINSLISNQKKLYQYIKEKI